MNKNEDPWPKLTKAEHRAIRTGAEPAVVVQKALERKWRKERNR